MSNEQTPKERLATVAASLMWLSDELRLWAKGETMKIPSLRPHNETPEALLAEIEQKVGIAREELAKIQ
jgi:hypothetical protein